MTDALKTALSALVRPVAAAATAWLCSRLPGLDPTSTETALASLLAALAAVAGSAVARREKE